MQSVRDIAGDIVAREGGLCRRSGRSGRGHETRCDDPHDAAAGARPRRRRRRGPDDVRAVTAEQATDIFIEHYFERPRIGGLPEVLQPSVFDMYVNAGSNAVRILQRLLRRMGHDIAVDGIIGPLTRSARPMRGGPRPTTSPTPTASRGGATTTASPTAARPAANTPAAAMAGRAAGSSGPRTFIAPRYHLSAARSIAKGLLHGTDRTGAEHRAPSPRSARRRRTCRRSSSPTPRARWS
jgi:hypothetical protein